MYGCVFGSTSGFTRSAIGRADPSMRRATIEIRASSLALSTLRTRTPASSAKAISSSVLPTPEKTTLRGSPPAFTTRNSSPPGDDVEARAEPREQRQDRRGSSSPSPRSRRGGGCRRGAVQHLPVPRERRGRVDVERRAVALGEPLERDASA